MSGAIHPDPMRALLQMHMLHGMAVHGRLYVLVLVCQEQLYAGCCSNSSPIVIAGGEKLSLICYDGAISQRLVALHIAIALAKSVGLSSTLCCGSSAFVAAYVVM
jgi:hypothetical protein